MRVLVTGGTGFTGQAVARDLRAHGHRVIVLTHRNRSIPMTAGPGGDELAVADIRDRDELARLVREAGIEGVCHLAALTRVRDSFADPTAYFDVNVGGSIALLAALDGQARRTGAPLALVFGSTGAVYGVRDGRLDEDEPTRPVNPYGASKLAAEALIGYQAATGRLAAVTLRCFNIAGRTARARGSCTCTMRSRPTALAVAAGTTDQLQVNGDGTAVREYTHVADVATAYRLALAAAVPGAHRIYNVGSGHGAAVTDIIDAVRRVTGRPLPVEHRPPAPEPALVLADSARIRAELGWRPDRSSLDEIVRDAWSATRTAPPDQRPT